MNTSYRLGVTREEGPSPPGACGAGVGKGPRKGQDRNRFRKDVDNTKPPTDGSPKAKGPAEAGPSMKYACLEVFYT